MNPNIKSFSIDKWPELTIPLYSDGLENIENRVIRLLEVMTLEEKVGQIIQPEILNITSDEIRQYHIGSVLNGGNGRPNRDIHASVDDWLEWADSFYEASVDTSAGRTAIPIIWGIDAIHGNSALYGATIFPHNIGLGAANNLELMKEIGRITALETSVIGLDWTFAPTVAVARDSRWGRTYESLSEDSAIVALLSKAAVTGLQGDITDKNTFFSKGRIIATAKHFIADGATESGIDQGDAKVDVDELINVHAQGFFSTLIAGVQTVMVSYSKLNGIRMHGHKELITDVLKDKLGFDGIVVSDFNGHAMIPGCSKMDCPQAINAGIDLFMVPKDWKGFYTSTIEHVRSGRVTQQRLNDAVGRILRVKMRAGLFEAGRPSSRPIAGKVDLLGSKDNRGVARQAVRESLVLLKNNNSTLPLNPKQNILITGAGADDIVMQVGGWSLNWQGTGLNNTDFKGATSIYSGIKNVVNSVGGHPIYSEDGSYTIKPNVAVVIFGETPYAEFQGDRENLMLWSNYENSLKALKRYKKEGIKTVSIFLSGRPLWVSQHINASDSFVVAWLPGSEGQGIADVIFSNESGDINFDFTGKLSFSWPRIAVQDGLNKGEAGYKPLFELGYGLSYKNNKNLEQLSEDSGLSVEAHRDLLASVFFKEGQSVSSSRLYIGDNTDMRTKTEGMRFVSSASNAISVNSIDRYRQEDAKELIWNGAENAFIFIRNYPPQDFSNQVERGDSIVIELNVIQPPTGKMNLKISSTGKGVTASVDITDVLRKLAGEGWTKLSIPLQYFNDGKLDFTKINMPMRLQTSKAAHIIIYDVRYGVAEGITVKCN